MIVDTSALVAVITGEPEAERLLTAMSSAADLQVSAATVVESGIVLHAKQGTEAVHDLHALLAELLADISPVDEQQAFAAIAAWERFGKGRHPAQLNLGDLFSYALASSAGLPLLYKRSDFTQTDISAVPY